MKYSIHDNGMHGLETFDIRTLMIVYVVLLLVPYNSAWFFYIEVSFIIDISYTKDIKTTYLSF